MAQIDSSNRARDALTMPLNGIRRLLFLIPLLVPATACNRGRALLALQDAGSPSKGDDGGVAVGSATPPGGTRSPEQGCPAGMALVTGEKFEMGSAQDWAYGATDPLWEKMLESTKPAHRVEVASFCLDMVPVSVANYQECVDKGGCTKAAERARTTIDDKARSCNAQREGYAGYPMNCVDREQASRYCAQKKARLPTEAEWELAARGTLEHLDMELARKCNSSDVTEATCSLAYYPMYRSSFGVYGMMLTEEWTSSTYCKYPSHDCKASKGVVRGRVLETDWERTLARWPRAPGERLRTLTFRCATDLSNQ